MLAVDKHGAHLTFSGLFAIFLSLMIFLIAALDHPFLGQYSISSGAFEVIRDVILPKIH